MIDFLKWWIFFLILGWAIFPLTQYIFRNLPTKGYGLSKIIALLLWGYLFWLGNTFSIFRNSVAAGWLVLLLISIVSGLLFYRDHKKIIAWIKGNFSVIIFSDALFLLAALFMLSLRIAGPEIVGTEKPMELAFLNAISQSVSFPPTDPWLSGYSISYYYFGYVIISLIAKVLATPSGVAFNWGLVFWFAMIAIVSSDLLINLLERGKRETSEQFLKIHFSSAWLSLFAPLFILIISNSEGFLELIHSLGFFWPSGSAGVAESSFWSWLDIRELVDAPPLPLDWNISRPGVNWWWRASRVLQDYTLAGQPREIIDEFPFFSFFLGDLHPHLLAMPFALVCVSMAFEIFHRDHPFQLASLKNIFTLVRDGDLWVLALICGSLIFLNTWDFPIYFALIGLVILIQNLQTMHHLTDAIKASFPTIAVLGMMSIILYVPFLISFSSQAGGILPSLIFQSRSIHQLVMFLPLLIPIVLGSIYSLSSSISRKRFLSTFTICIAFYLLAIFFSYLFTLLMSRFAGQNLISYLSIYGAENVRDLMAAAFNKMLRDPWMDLLLLSLIATTIALASEWIHSDNKMKASISSDIFIGMLVSLAALLVLFPEVFYLRDQFGWRMNTIFKFYFQAWILFAMAAAYSFARFLSSRHGLHKALIFIICMSGIIAGLVYPAYALNERLRGTSIDTFQIDGTAYFSMSNPDEMQAVQFLQQNGCGVLAEAVGGSYTQYGRISKYSGCPTVLGWPGHEMQWRGSIDPLGSRDADIRTLYTTRDWMTAAGIIEKYAIQYIVVGDLERSSYQTDVRKFSEHLPVLFQNDTVVIYGLTRK